MKPTDNDIKPRRRSPFGKPSLLEFQPTKTASGKRMAQATSPSPNGSARSKTKKKASHISGRESENGSTPTPEQEEIISVRDLKRQDAALRRLNVTRQQLDLAPQISPLLKQADGGLKHVLSAMRLIPDEVISAFLEKYDSIGQEDRRKLPIEAVALAAGVDINALLGSIMLALQAAAVNAVKIIAMTSHPKITAARVQYGQLPFGERDRTALDTAMGFLPSPKGMTVISKAIFGTGKAAMEEQGAEVEDKASDPDTYDLDALFPPAQKMQEALIPIRNRQLPDKT